jgi:alkylated DNA repair protein (DNA oxidative demethylase)
MMPAGKSALDIQPAAAPGSGGLRLHPGYLDRGAQMALVAALEQIFAAAPLFTPRMPKSGRPMSVRMSNCGPLGWITDEAGYRYEPDHPVTKQAWPPMPDVLIAAWNELGGYRFPPQACLINFYGEAAKMGLHQDRDE